MAKRHKKPGVKFATSIIILLTWFGHLETCGLEMPKVYKGVEQYPLSGVSMKDTFDATPDAPTQKHVQYYTMLGTRAIWKDG